MRITVRSLLPCTAMTLAAAALAGAQSPRTHRLEATPATVAYGYYWSEAKPVLRIASGDIIDVDTMLTSTPDRLEKAGVKPEDVQASLRAIVDQRHRPRTWRTHPHRSRLCRRRGTGRRAPGGHRLDRPADPLRLQRLRRLHPRELRAGASHHHHPAGSAAHDRRPSVPASRFRSSRSSAAWASRRRRRPAGSAVARRAFMRAISTTRNWSRARRSTFPCTCQVRCSRSATAMPRKATARWIRPPSKRRCAAASG